MCRTAPLLAERQTLVCVAGTAITAQGYYRQLLSLSAKGYRAVAVQCCAEAAMSGANSRATEIGLSGQNPGRRGSIPDAMGSLGAL